MLLSDGDVIGRHVGFRSEWAQFLPFLQCRRSFWVLFKELSELLRLLARPGEVPSRASRLSISRNTRNFSGAYAPITLEKMDFQPRDHGRRCNLFGEKPLILLGLHSWLQLDFVQAVHPLA